MMFGRGAAAKARAERSASESARRKEQRIMNPTYYAPPNGRNFEMKKAATRERVGRRGVLLGCNSPAALLREA